MALGVVTLRTIEYIFDASTKTFLMAVFCAQKCGKNTFWIQSVEESPQIFCFNRKRRKKR